MNKKMECTNLKQNNVEKIEDYEEREDGILTTVGQLNFSDGVFAKIL